jgi:thymidylate synthase
MNNLDKQYTDLLQDILDNGVTKQDRTGTGTISVFGRQIRHKMSEGFPLLTTKKMPFKTITTELLWFLRGDTNIKYLVDNDCHIWDGDAYKNYLKNWKPQPVIENELHWMEQELVNDRPLPKDMFIHCIKTDNEFAKKWGELGPIYGKQWRSWGYREDLKLVDNNRGDFEYEKVITTGVDQIANLINDLKTNPDSRRLMVNAWNVGELDQMVLPPCHFGFQVYTRELSLEERTQYKKKRDGIARTFAPYTHQMLDGSNIPTRAISLMWNQRSVDTFLGLPFNIASYGLLLEIIAKAVNMVPDELIGNLGDVHLYSNHIEQAKEQIGRDYTLEERLNMVSEEIQNEFSSGIVNLPIFPNTPVRSDGGKMALLDDFGVPRRTREHYPLPTLNINTEFWPTENGSCGEGPLDATAVFNSFKDENFCKCLLEEDIQLGNYQSHPTIKAPLSN